MPKTFNWPEARKKREAIARAFSGGNIKLQGLVADMAPNTDRKPWVEPAIRELEIQETHAFPGLGNDLGGNAFPDCQRS